MERVQIVSGANGVFHDNQGRTLQTMGDISPNVGDWVWTNGTTIYGHRESGEMPGVISLPGSPVLPVCFSGTPAEGCSYQQLGNIKKDGTWEHFVNFSYRDKPLNGYVGDGNHAYGCVWGEKYYKWYNLLTGEYLGEFDFDDACIGEHGELLTIEHQDYSETFARNDTPSVTSVKEEFVDFEGKMDTEGYDLFCGGDISYTSYFPFLYSNDGKASKSEAKKIEGYIRIRANGKEIRKIDLARYANQIKESVMQRIRSVESAGNASGEEVLPERAKPTSGMDSIYVSCSHLRIYKNGEFFAFAYGSGSGYAYPYITVPGINFTKSLHLNDEGTFYVGKVKATKSQYSDIDWTEVHSGGMDSIEENAPCYKHEYTKEAEIDTSIKGYRYWITLSVFDSLMVGLGKAEGEYLNGEGVSARNNGAVIGAYTTATNGTDENEVHTDSDWSPKPYSMPILAGYPFQAVWMQVPSGYVRYTEIKEERMHKYMKNKAPFSIPLMSPKNKAFKTYSAHHSIVVIGSSGALGLILRGSNRDESIKEKNKTVLNRDWTKEAWNNAGGNDYATTRSEMHPIPKTYDLGNGFTICLKLYREYDVNSCRGFSLYDKGQMIFDTDTSGSLSYWSYRFEGIKLIKLSENKEQGKYLMINSLTSDPPFLIENGKCTALPNIYTVYKTYTLAYFRRRKKLKQGIENIKSSW